MDATRVETNESFGPGAPLRKKGEMVSQGLTDLRRKVGGKRTLPIPADHAASQHETAVGRHAVGISLRRRPTTRLQYLRTRGRSLVLCHRQHGKRGPFWRAHRHSSLTLVYSAAMLADAHTGPSFTILR